MRIIDKTGPLANPADRDHCLQYMVALALLKGDLAARDYEDEAASDPRIDRLREKIRVTENPRFTADYHDPSKRSIANAVQLFFRDGTSSTKLEVEYPLGHRRRRVEAVPLLREKFSRALATRFTPIRSRQIPELFADPGKLAAMPCAEFMDFWIA